MYTNGNEKLRIGELAAITNVSKRTIDYYTNLGLLTAHRTPSNYRFYERDAIEKIKIIKELKNKNLSLEDIKSFFKRTTDDEQDISKLHDKLKVLEKDVSEILEIIEKNKLDKSEIMNKHVSHESVALLQSLLLLLL
ncbi:MerR family transcriptional regulator [Bacillus sp. AGMB 02131]|uniref:MerR family transcriptional regulator n=1 Tax=Peribacillus faecalis TaxID=2772559 RepID=A0A927HC12_9BACI|nr:MerR family transcriptional regulator [Peribacillus faecalis]MBD3109086.1 MerR family transcriptional regulator [Peribacillus faecalis]